MIKKRLGIDKRDEAIIRLLQEDPEISQEKIAQKLKLSQPSIWARIRKLKEKGIIKQIIGMDFKKVDLNLAKVNVSTTNAQDIINEFQDCPYFLNGLIMSGKFNLTLFFTGINLIHIEGILNKHLRNNPKVKEVDLQIVISSSNSLVMPTNIFNKAKCDESCKELVNKRAEL